MTAAGDPILTVSKRFEFSASRKLDVPQLSAEANFDAYGAEASASYGTGHNYVAFFGFGGIIDSRTGFLISIGDIKERIGTILANYDHKFLNGDVIAFQDRPPTTEALSKLLLTEATPLFSDHLPAVCHLCDPPERAATSYQDGRLESHYTLSFSAARSTSSPDLSDAENSLLFGKATAIHGHNYVLKVTIAGKLDETTGVIVPNADVARALDALHGQLDHKFLNRDVPGLRGQPITTEFLASYILKSLGASLPVDRVRLNETSSFFAEYDCHGRYYLGTMNGFHASHRLHSPAFSRAENAETYGKCNNPRGHGHYYQVEATIAGDFDVRSGTLYDLGKLQAGMQTAIAPWAYKHLDLETDDFRDRPSTGENILAVLWPRMNRELEDRLVRLRLWETANNRFTMRKLSAP